MIEINQPERDRRHKRLMLEQEKRRQTEVRGGLAYWMTGLTMLALGAIGLLLFGGMGDVVGIVFSAAAIAVGIGCMAFGKLIVLLFRKGPKGSKD